MKYYIIDIETNGITNPSVIWCIVIEDYDTGEVWEFLDRKSFRDWLDERTFEESIFVGHNIIDYDAKVIRDLWKFDLTGTCLDTLILSRLHSPKSKNGHSLEAWGNSLQFPKQEQPDFSYFSREMLEYCRQDVRLTKALFKYLMSKVGDWKWAIEIEHRVAIALRDAKETGFYFDVPEAINLLRELRLERDKYDDIIHTAYPPKEVGVRVKKLVPFNPNSPKQVIDKLWEAGWKPEEKTKGHKDFERERKENSEEYQKRKDRFERYGWRISETNLATLPEDAPEAAKSILKRTIYETRVRKLNEWLDLVQPDGCIHGDVIGVGTWTHRMAHRHPNMANISAKKSIKYHTEELKEIAEDLGGRMRALWTAKPGKVLVGTDAEGIQLRVLAHYMDDPEFTKAVTEGNKDDGTDPHSLNRVRIGRGTRDNAKTFIYA
ncbi:MAG: hypothetical protein GF334_02755, partial [Candidatus Altiarchaeales archaeon]|nr:hypothetical protein [Candidatus Altiarchaeales archaeon]